MSILGWVTIGVGFVLALWLGYLLVCFWAMLRVAGADQRRVTKAIALLPVRALLRAHTPPPPGVDAFRNEHCWATATAHALSPWLMQSEGLGLTRRCQTMIPTRLANPSNRFAEHVRTVSGNFYCETSEWR